MVRLGRVALDGTKLRANASRPKAMSYQRAALQFVQTALELLACELPSNRPGLTSVLGLEGEDARGQCGQAVGVGRHLPMPAGLDRGLLVGGDDLVAAAQALALPEPGVKVEDRSGPS
jgi:hypothetical protein